MSVAKHMLVVLLLTLVALGGALWQVQQSEAGAGGERQTSFRLICPLH